MEKGLVTTDVCIIFDNLSKINVVDSEDLRILCLGQIKS